ncbi:hypothetical protein [Opitutus sp. ER46]|uniref:DUF7305 domain-containing protein n=1 Tax=Opitutus sp. ER46 TaxID=2161864 RepID=UPI0011B231E6|nr:hypothetical protein [Opitutus sp. ER46]
MHPTPASAWPAPAARNRGSVLMVALILAAVLAISLTSYLQLTTHSGKMANRSFYMDGAQNLADVGLEHALWAMNNGGNWTAANFALRSGATDQYQGTFPSASDSFPFSAGARGQVKVWVDLTNPRVPHAVALATITLADGSRIEKQSEAFMKERSYFEQGMVGDTITFKGQVTVDSWISDGDNNPSTPAVPYTTSVARDNGKVGATALIASALSGGQGDVAGSVFVGSSETGGGITLGSQGAVGDFAWINANTGVQEGHATYDFTADFPDVSNPTPPAGTTVYTLTSAATTLPRRDASGNLTDTPGSDGNYYYKVSAIDLSGNTDTMTIQGGNVILTTTNPTGTTVKATGNHSGIVVDAAASLKIYTAGDVAITGNGILNGGAAGTVATANQPINCQIYGTRSSATAGVSGTQKFDIKGNGHLSSVVYAPNGDVTISGNGAVLGSIVGQTVVMNGNAAFHFDESLADNLGSGLWKLQKWRELSTPAERATYAAALAF